MIFAVGTAGGEAVPRRVDGAAAVGRDRSAAVDAVAAPREIALRLERGSLLVRSRVEKRRARLAARRIHQTARHRRVRSVPGHVHASAAADGDLAAADRARRDRAALLAVHAHGRGEGRSVIGRADVKQVSGARLAGKVEQVQHAACVDDGLGLNAAVRHASKRDRAVCVDRGRRTERQDDGRCQDENCRAARHTTIIASRHAYDEDGEAARWRRCSVMRSR